jgi:hypothetical protein
MKLRIFFLLPVITAACREYPVSEPVNENSVVACMAAQETNDDYVIATKCEPLGPSLEFRGTWFVGFESSLFVDGYTSVPAQVDPDGQVAELIVPTRLARSYNPENAMSPAAFQVSFVGRKSALPSKSGRYVIVLDNVISIRSVNYGQ